MANGINTTPLPTESPLARRLAHAAAGYANEGNIYFLALPEPVQGKLYDLSLGYRQMHTNPADVDERDRHKVGNSAYSWFGPYETDDATQHTPYAITHITVHLKNKSSGEEMEINIPTDPADRKRFDALFWSQAAVEKFAIPYYAGLHGGDYADRVLNDFLADDLYLMGHRPITEYTNPEAPTITAVSLTRGNKIEFSFIER